jgi:hypothetical protein
MGILDEAIREHLDLKRRQGATASELDQLEHEAFGPPTRPGEPDFPERAPEGAEAGGEEAPESMAAEAETMFMPPEDAVAPAEAAEEIDVAAPEEPEPVETAESPAEAEAAVEAEAGPAEAESLFYDQESDEEMDLGELGLELDEEGEPGAEAAPLEEEPPSPGDETPIESLETVEHPIEELGDEPPLPEEPGVAADEGEAAPEHEEGEESADVLEETPEFLRDQPEDDELWFEQGEPKDFDF